MEVVSASPLPVGSLLWRSRPDAWMLTFACKATFELLPGEARLAAAQEPILSADRHHGDDPARSLYAASDLVPFKPAADVLLVGSAYAPGERPVRSLFVRLIAGDVDKSLEVAADSAFHQDGLLHEGAAFTRMALVYERAAGGPDTWNPVGIRGDVRDAYGRVRVPNLRPPGLHISSPAEVIPPVGFGPIAAHWPGRRDKLGRHAHGWSARSILDRPLPDDIDRAFFNAAPFEQRLPLLREDQRLILENLHPELPRLVTSLPGLRPRARVEAPSGTRMLGLKCDTLWIDTDRRLCTLTWSSQLPLEGRGAKGRVIIETDAPVRPVVPAVKYRETMPTLDEEDVRLLASALPFVQTASSPSTPRWPAQAETLPPPPPRSQAQAETLPPPPPPPHAQAETLPPPPPPPQAQMQAETLPPPPRVAAFPAAVEPLRAPVPASPWAAAAAGIEQAAAPSIGEAAVTAAGAEGPLLPAQTSFARPIDAAVRPAAPAAPREVLHLIWYDPESIARICAVPVFRATVDDLTRERLEGFEELEDGSPAKDPAELEDRRDVFSILARAATMDVAELGEELHAAVRPDRKFVPPLLLLAGELSLPFAEREVLNATVGVISPLVSGDEVLKAAVDDALDLLDASHLICPPEVVEGMTARIKEVFQKAPRKFALDYVEAQIERALLARRAYQRRHVLGMTAIRALLHPDRRWGAGAPAPAYLPEELAGKLPVYSRFRARLIAELHLRTDQYEAHPGALKVLALCRVSTITA